MAATPKYKAFDSANQYVACFKYREDAASFAAFRGNGTTIRLGHAKADTIWSEGAEAFSAGESYDRAADMMREREIDLHRVGLKRAGYSDEKIDQFLRQ